jgi:membrane protein YdbS with pleckstrin-like domain
MPSEIMTRLQQVRLFAKLDREDLREMARLVREKTYSAGETICRQGQPGHSLYIIKSGQVRVLSVDPQGVEQEVKRLDPGSYFGETSLLLGEPRDATIEAITDVVFLTLHRDDLAPLLQSRPGLIKSFQMRPAVAEKYHARRAHFKWQEEGETVVVSQHRHDVMLLRNILLPTFIFMLALAACIYWYQEVRSPLPVLIGAFLWIVIVLLVVYLFLDHRDDIYVVTDKRVVLREHKPMGRESRVEAPLRTIQDIQETQVGLLAQIFDFGDLIIETAGEKGHVSFREIPDPEDVREIIFEQIRRLQTGAKIREREAIREDMRRYFEPHFLPGVTPI